MTWQDLVKTSIQEGGLLAGRRWGLTLLLYFFNLIIGLILAVPVLLAVSEHIGETGFGADMLAEFDPLLWRELIDKISDVLAGLLLLMLLVVPLYWIWKTAAHMGVIYALHNGAMWPFWRGVGQYTLKGLALGFIFLPLKVLVAILSIFLAGMVRSFFPGEVGLFWCVGVLMPVLILTTWSILDLYQRYARVALVVRHDSVFEALTAGITWPSKYGAASLVYLIWYAVSLGILGVSFLLNAKLHVGISAILVGFLVQQVSLITRAAASVAWTGSEVSLFERTYVNELPLIADADNAVDGGT